MPLLLPNSTFLMIPRCGTTWARQAIRSAGIRYREHGPKHSTDLPSGRPFVFTFTRDPATWLRSRWTLGPWEDELASFWTPDREEFCRKVSPEMVSMYFAKYTSRAQFVGKQETLADDLVKALRTAGEKFNEKDLRATPAVNENGPEYHLLPDVLWQMDESDWVKLPAEEIVLMPAELLKRASDEVLAKLSPAQMLQVSRRLTDEVLSVAPAPKTKPERVEA